MYRAATSPVVRSARGTQNTSPRSRSRPFSRFRCAVFSILVEADTFTLGREPNPLHVATTLRFCFAVVFSASSLVQIQLLGATQGLGAQPNCGPRRRAEVLCSFQDDTAQLPRSARTGPLAVGRMSKSKMAVGKYNEQQAFGMSTTPLTRPSIGAAPSNKYACAPE